MTEESILYVLLILKHCTVDEVMPESDSSPVSRHGIHSATNIHIVRPYIVYILYFIL